MAILRGANIRQSAPTHNNLTNFILLHLPEPYLSIIRQNQWKRLVCPLKKATFSRPDMFSSLLILFEITHFHAFETPATKNSAGPHVFATCSGLEHLLDRPCSCYRNRRCLYKRTWMGGCDRILCRLCDRESIIGR